MSRKTLTMTKALQRYLLAVSLREPPGAERLRLETAQHAKGFMQIAPEQGQFLAWLVRLMGARWILEVGTFTGYSALWMASAMPPGQGRLLSCDINPNYTAIAERHWRRAGLQDRIELRIAPALEVLEKLPESGDEMLDLVFLDGDKADYLEAYEHSLRLLRPGGVIAVDNVLWSGRTADPQNQETDTLAIRTFNEALRDDPRIELCMLPIADGLSLAMKRHA